MSAWAYCRACDAPLEPSSIQDIADGCQMCPHCHEINPLNRNLYDVLRDMEERLTALEERSHDHAD